MRIIIFAIGFFISLQTYTTSDSFAKNTYIISKSSDSDFNDIQIAINNCRDDDELIIQDGTYLSEGIIVDKYISLKGNNRETVKIITNGNYGIEFSPKTKSNNKALKLENISFDFVGGDCAVPTLSLRDKTYINECNIYASGPCANHALWIQGGPITVKNSVIMNNGSDWLIYFWENTGYNVFTNNNFILKDNQTFFGLHEGLSDADIIFKNNIFYSTYGKNKKINLFTVSTADKKKEEMIINEKINVKFSNNLFNKPNIVDMFLVITFGERNIFNIDPLFADFDKRDFRLSKHSICLGSGYNGEDIGAIPFKDPAPNLQKINIEGRYIAFLIGISQYSHLDKLETPVSDVNKINDILKNQYHFDTIILTDKEATRVKIIETLNRLKKELTPIDKLLIYYAGHGYFDKDVQKAYWLPVDSKRNDDTRWIIADTISTNLKRIAANHIIVIADSCYSGTFNRGIIRRINSFDMDSRYHFVKKMLEKKARILISSGGNEPVIDSGGGNHSIFAKTFMNGLKKSSGIFTSEELFVKEIKEKVAGNASQTPEYQIISNSGHDGGDFVFFKY